MLDAAKLGYYHIIYPLVYALFTFFKDLILSCQNLSSPVKIYNYSIAKLVQKSKKDRL